MEGSCTQCEKRARINCDSDQAKLCWYCDQKVHSANFLVAKHARVLLCRLCRSPTPWIASGPNLTPAVSFCYRCMANRQANSKHEKNDDDDRDYVDHDGEYSYGADSDSDYIFDEEEEGESQVVPSNASASCDAAALKRSRDDSSDLYETQFSLTALPSTHESTSVGVFRLLKPTLLRKS